jgi:hypothetical protein
MSMPTRTRTRTKHSGLVNIEQAGAGPDEELFRGSFRWSAIGWSWGHVPARALSTDGTILLSAESVEQPGWRAEGYVSLRLRRDEHLGPFHLPLGDDEAREVVSAALADRWIPGRGDREKIFDEARWLVEGELEETDAPRWAGASCEILEDTLRLGSQNWMQDWPLEVADPRRLEEFCGFYDHATDPAVRFDVMWLVLCSYEQRLHQGPEPDVERWLDRVLRRDFPLHGHTVRYWARLDLAGRDHDDEGRPLTPQMRRVWRDCLVPVPLR